MTANELRQKYLEFFKSKGHAVIPSASVVPENDPTVLFTTAGMHPLVPYLLGQPHPAGKRLVDYQRCIRTGDIEEVGDESHLTFFTMLGNWSLGDYFKKESIAWSFEFLTSSDWLNIPLTHLAFTVFAGDTDAPFDAEAYQEWLNHGVAEERISKMPKADNWWGPAGKTGPCGPDTEIFYWVGEGEPQGNKATRPNDWMEIWNNVFMQFNKQEDGTLVPLGAPSVDTGMGLERTIVALQKKTSVYETELFVPILHTLRHLADPINPMHERIIVDHLRAACVMLMDGVVPSNKDQGYVLRRLIRRAIRHLNKPSPTDLAQLLTALLESITATLVDAYPGLIDKAAVIRDELIKESVKFEKTLQQGMREFEKLHTTKGAINGLDAFNLYQSYGFPWELTEEMAREKGQVVDKSIFEQEFRKHQELSRAGAEKKFAGGLADHSEQSTNYHTATHLLHQALRTVLGDHVHQMGSNITQERLRFDFSHDHKMTDQQIKAVEEIVNEQIQKNLPVHFKLLSVEEAKAAGAIGLFEDKYTTLGDKIKVYFVGDETRGYFSKEICGGPHVENTGKMGHFSIVKEEASSAGVRRIKAVLE